MLSQPKNGDYFNTIRIRAHHLLCLQGYQGHGYTKEFEENMDKIVNLIKKFPTQKLEIIAECDDICSCCLHNADGICKAEENSDFKIKYMDIKVLEKLAIEENTVDSALNLFNLVNQRLDKLDVIEICGSCAWRMECLWFKERNTQF